MAEGQTALSRDCEAVQIPAGTTVTLAAGTPVVITQTLGGAYTVSAPGGLFRIASKDGDALGIVPTAPAPTAAAPTGASEEEKAKLLEKTLWEQLKTCYDPEIPVNIVDLGLIYDLRTSRAAGGGYKVDVKMTLTARGCGMGPAIAGDAQQKLLAIDDVEEANVELVWDPPWYPSMISPEGKKRLGIEG